MTNSVIRVWHLQKWQRKWNREKRKSNKLIRYWTYLKQTNTQYRKWTQYFSRDIWKQQRESMGIINSSRYCNHCRKFNIVFGFSPSVDSDSVEHHWITNFRSFNQNDASVQTVRQSDFIGLGLCYIFCLLKSAHICSKNTQIPSKSTWFVTAAFILQIHFFSLSLKYDADKQMNIILIHYKFQFQTKRILKIFSKFYFSFLFFFFPIRIRSNILKVEWCDQYWIWAKSLNLMSAVHCVFTANR